MARHRWAAGQSGNPSGRPRGTSDRRNAYRDLLAPQVPKLLAKLIDLAMAGDVAAAKLLLDRMIPAVRHKDIAEVIPMVGSTLAERAQTVTNAAAEGEVSTAVAEAAIGLLQGQARLIETTELLQRIEKLESAQAAPK